nr:MAG TPA: tail collar domain [Caudoviricetes sp.]
MSMINTINDAINRKISNISFTDIVTGIVVSENPLLIKIKDKIIIDINFINKNSLNIKDNNLDTINLKLNEKLELIRYNNGQKFYILGKKSDSSGSYKDISDKPYINTNNKDSLEVNNKEVIDKIINLHKVSKTGDFNDLNNIPDLEKYIISEDKSINNWITCTLSEFNNLKSSSRLKKGTVYNVTDNQINAITSLPVGSISFCLFDKDKLPINYMVCEGQELDRNQYAELFSLIGTKFGKGDNINTFNLPDLRGKVLVGLDNSNINFNEIGKMGGEEKHKLISSEIPKISIGMPHIAYTENTRSITDGNITEEGNTYWEGWINSNSADTNKRILYNYGGDLPHNNLQPYITGYYIIKVLEEAETKQLRNLDKLVYELKQKVDKL